MFWFLLACTKGVAPSDKASTGDDDSQVDETPTLLGTLRVATWNTEELGAPSSAEHKAMLAVLARIDADVVGFNEVLDEEQSDLQSLASSAGYDHVYFSDTSPFGELNNAFISRLLFDDKKVWDSKSLCGESGVKDVTREPMAVTVSAPDGQPVTVVVNHFKSGYDNDDEFRRAVDARQTYKAAQTYGERVLIMGDFNAQLEDDGTESPSTFTSQPGGIPSSYSLCGDVESQLKNGGIPNEVFSAFEGYTVLESERPNGKDGTRWVSGRKIDWLVLSPGLAAVEHVDTIYHSKDENLDTRYLEWAGSYPDRSDSEDASDHLPVVVEFSFYE